MLLLRGATSDNQEKLSSKQVSIHAPLARSNRANRRCSRGNMVSIHAPLARSNRSGEFDFRKIRSFNTCSSCEEQLGRGAYRPNGRCFNTCSSCEEQLHIIQKARRIHSVSIHAPLARSNSPRRRSHQTDRSFNTCSSCEEQQLRITPVLVPHTFQYMLLLRGATAQVVDEGPVFEVSIHAPLARSNSDRRRRLCGSGRFNTCSSCEEQLLFFSKNQGEQLFQYMLLLRGATKNACYSF